MRDGKRVLKVLELFFERGDLLREVPFALAHRRGIDLQRRDVAREHVFASEQVAAFLARDRELLFELVFFLLERLFALLELGDELARLRGVVDDLLAALRNLLALLLR